MQPTDRDLAKKWRASMVQTMVELSAEQEKTVIEALINAQPFIGVRLHDVATDPSHLHALVSWRHARTHASISNSLRTSITLTLKEKCGHQKWLSRDHSRKRIEDQKHFDHLQYVYLPNHRGWKWNEDRGFYLRIEESQ